MLYMIIKRGNVCFWYHDNMGIIDVYYQMIVDMLKRFIFENPAVCLNITLGNNDHRFNNDNRTIRISINYEHTLVKIGGRDVPPNTPFGNVCDDNNNKYFVRIDRYDELMNSDIVIDYSIPNIQHVYNSGVFSDFSKKQVYISSSVYDLYFAKENRNITTLTTFINTEEERRKTLLREIKNHNISHRNVNTCFGKTELQELYKSTKIMINIHQTPHHHTFEELRVLPALECGVIVISEVSPLHELVPYHELVVWVPCEDIIEKTKEIIANYDVYHDSIFTETNIRKLRELKNENYDRLCKMVL